MTFIKNNFEKSYFKVINQQTDKMFLIFVDDAGTRNRYTYNQFNCDVDKVIDVITVLDAKNSFEACIFLSENSYELIVYIFAVLLSGKIAIFINPNEDDIYIEEQIKKISSTRLILSDRPRSHCQSTIMSIPDKINFSKKTKKRKVKNINNDFIYVLTSGSTGQSKFVRLSERSLLVNIEALIQHHDLYKKKIIIGTALPLFHVNALGFSLMTTFFSGGQLVLWKKFNILNFFQIMKDERIQIYSAIPSILSAIGHFAKSTKNTYLKYLNYFVSAATYLPAHVCMRIHLITHKKIIQGYGLSEAVNFSCLLPINISAKNYKKLMLDSKYPSIGKSIFGNEVTVISDDGQICQSDQIGELYIKGLSLMTGYLHEKESIIDSINGLPTGDLGYFQIIEGEKYFFLTGRRKDIIKKNGETIGLRDIEERIASADINGFDFIIVPFESKAHVEEIGLIYILSKKLEINWLEKLEDILKTLTLNRRPKKCIEIKNLKIRTPSGKPLRWKFRYLFENNRNS